MAFGLGQSPCRRHPGYQKTRSVTPRVVCSIQTNGQNGALLAREEIAEFRCFPVPVPQFHGRGRSCPATRSRGLACSFDRSEEPMSFRDNQSKPLVDRLYDM